MKMDEQLRVAVAKRDKVFLNKAFALQPPEYFLAQNEFGKSIFHIAAGYDNTEFMKKTMKVLPTNILKQLLLITDDSSYNLLHEVTSSWCPTSILKCVVEMYASLSWDGKDHVKPWLALSCYNETPLNRTLRLHYQAEERVMEIMLLDPELESCTIADEDGKTPLYYAVKNGCNRVAEKILKSPHPAASILGSSDALSLVRLATNSTESVVRWLLEKCDGYLDNDGNTPLHSALQSTSTEEVALQTLSTYPAMRHIRNKRGESPFFLAVKAGCNEVVAAIMEIEEPRYHMLCCNDGTTVFHSLSSCSEKTGRILLEKYWWIINLQDDQGKAVLANAEQTTTDWLVNLLTNPSLIKKQDFDWKEACKREESDAVLAFINNCQDLQRVCRKGKDTLLHHVRLPSYEDYLNFLKIPLIEELKNTTGDGGATPLHCALKRKDIQFAKALLSDHEVDRNVQDFYGCTSMDLLAKLCKENHDWARMCKEIDVNPSLRTTYIQPGTNLDQMRNTLSVIAALLSTITFAAGFTLPGGINSNNGEALLAKKAAFLVFLLADAYAMCTSMLVLFCLVWSMVSKLDMARWLVDRSVFILMHSLYATLLAFMTGVYTVIEHSSLWAAIVIFVMCSVIGISANRTILHMVIAWFVPAANGEKQDQTRLLEEGRIGTSTTEAEEISCCYILHVLKSRTMSIFSSAVDKCKFM